MFRTTDFEDLDKDNVQFVFELVVYVNKNSETIEYTCGWGHCSISNADKQQSNLKIALHGGSPNESHAIECDDVSKKGGILNNVKSLFSAGSSASKNELSISI